MVEKKRSNKKDWIIRLSLFLTGMVILMFVSREKSFFLQNDSIRYMSMDFVSGIMPLYQIFLHLCRMFFGENSYLISVVFIQTVFAVLGTIVLEEYLREHFSLDTFSVVVCFLGLLILYNVDYVYAGMSHQILTEALTFPLFYIYLKYVLKSLWEETVLNSIIHMIIAGVMACIRSQMKMMLLISVAIIVYVYIRDIVLKKEKNKNIIKGVIFAFVICGCSLLCVSGIDRLYQYVILTEDNVSDIPLDRGISQANGAMSYKINYAMEEEDYKLFEDESTAVLCREIYNKLDEEKKLYKYADTGINRWRSMLACSATNSIVKEVYKELEENPPEISTGVYYANKSAIKEIRKTVLKKHWITVVKVDSIFALHGLMCAFCIENEEHLVLCYVIAFLGIIGSIIIGTLVLKDKNADKDTVEMTFIVGMISLALILMVSVVLFTIRRYVCYGVGAFYVGCFLMVRSLWMSKRMKKTLFLQPRTGFCSRLLVLNESYHLAKEMGARLVIIWKQTEDCNLDYFLAFDKKQFSDIDCVVKQTFEIKDLLSRQKEALLEKKYGEFFSNIGLVFNWLYAVITLRRYRNNTELFFPYDKRDRACQAADYEQMKARLAEGKSVYCMAYEGLTGYQGEGFYELSAMKFSLEMIAAAKEIVGEEKTFVGVHIRRTDHVVAIANSKTEDFEEKMDKVIAKDPEVKFFLATDDMNEENRIVEKYGDRIMVQKNKDLRRSSKEGMRCSIIDCLCLSMAKYIIGSQRSIFSKVSAELNNIKLILANEDME